LLIIVEGPDGSGKTTFVERLREYGHSIFGTPRVLHARPPKDHPLIEYETPLLNYRPGIGEHIICDRWHWGESIYPQVLGRSTQYDLAVRRHVELFLLKKGAVVAYVKTPWELAAARVVGRGDDIIHPSQVYQLTIEYGGVARRTLLPTVTVPGDRSVTVVTLETVLTAAREAEKQAWPLDSFTTYVGPLVPKVLLLGDVRHEFRRDAPKSTSPVDTRSPAFGPFPATSGHYLLTHLRTVRNVGVANACDVDDWRCLYARLGRPRVAALGQHAHRRIGSTPHGVVPHPQFVRRFHHHYGSEYAAVIERAIEGEDLSKWRP
jgi:hypothetical protein